VAVFFPNFAAEERDVPPPTTWPAPVFANLEKVLHACCGGDRAFAFLGDADVVVAWLNTPAAARFAVAQGRPLHGAPVDVVHRVHDKAFCAAVVEAHKLNPPALDAAIHVFDAKDVDTRRLLALIDEQAATNALVHRGLTAKPRHGSSGRGRVDLRRREAIPGAVARLRTTGGCIVEPWLERVVDLAAAWNVDADGHAALLGTSVAEVSGGGVWKGCVALIDDEGVPRAPSVWQARLVDQSELVVRAAAAQGFRGPCGVDAFVYDAGDGVERLRLVEFNARFTAGLLAVVLARGRAAGTAWRFCPSTSPDLVLWPLEERPSADVLERSVGSPRSPTTAGGDR
jgi:hypothetical protein